MAAIFQNGRPKVRFSNISASSSLRIVILVSKHTYLGARIPVEPIANTYLMILVSKLSYLGARIQMVLIASISAIQYAFIVLINVY